MFNKDQQQPPATAATPSPTPKPSTEQTRIGPSVSLEGTLTCQEDLWFDGKLKGSVSVPSHRVVVGSKGLVKANVHARLIEVEGRVVGDLVGVERVVVTATGQVVGNIRAPRVSLENGAQFKGSIDMDPAETKSDAGGVQRKGPRPSVTAPGQAPKASANAS